MNRGSGKSSDETLIEMNRTAWSNGGKCPEHAFTRFYTRECFKIRREKYILCVILKLATTFVVHLSYSNSLFRVNGLKSIFQMRTSVPSKLCATVT